MTVSLFGRYMLESKSEFPRQTTQMSPDDMLLQAPSKPSFGEQAVVYLDDFGRFEWPALTASLSPARRGRNLGSERSAVRTPL